MTFGIEQSDSCIKKSVCVTTVGGLYKVDVNIFEVAQAKKVAVRTIYVTRSESLVLKKEK